MRPDDPELVLLLGRFVTVRMTSLKGVDLHRFPFDYDLTFALLATDSAGRVYSRFGTRDEHDGMDRMSIAGLKTMLRQVLELHERQGAAEGEAPAGRPFTTADFPAFARTKRANEACYHCHYANDARFMQLRLEGRFSREDLFMYPHPENIGLTLEVDRNNIIRSLKPGSPAAQAGLAPGDRIVRAGATPVLTAADLQFALNPVKSPGRVTMTVERSGKRLPPFTLNLPAGWRISDISWRPSQGAIPPIIGIWEKPLTDRERELHGIAPGRLALQISFLFPEAKWGRSRAGLRLGDIIIDVDERDLPAMTPRQFHSWYRLNKKVGETARLRVIRGGQRMTVEIPCLDTGELE